MEAKIRFNIDALMTMCVYNLSADILPFYMFNPELTKKNKYSSHFNYIFVINIKIRNKVTKM